MIQRQLAYFDSLGKDVVLLCYEDIKKPGDWCYRTAFAEWYKLRTGITIEELPETGGKREPTPTAVQTSLFDLLR